ncbi:MAG TPA: diguanylate cyclase [Pyrinomonadaceae bacterium]|nr:diguanylate cyclase [Pyrinomonadaceae bacterium]
MTRRPRKTEVYTGDEPEIVQEHPEDAPPGWEPMQEKLAANAGLSLLLVDGRQPPAILVSNNNSICHAFQSSHKYVSLCDPYCGDAHRRAMSAGSVVQYKCHAGLQCFTMPVQIGKQQNLATIGGRAFTSGADYRSLVERFRAGELNELLVKEPFNNVIFAEEERLEKLAEKVDKAVRQLSIDWPQTTKTESQAPVAEKGPSASTVVSNDPGESNSPPETVDSGSALQTEVDRLRGELEYRSQLAESLSGFLERISSGDPSRTYQAILDHVAELLQAERASLWLFDENSNEIVLRATLGFSIDDESRIGAGQGIAGGVIESGVPLVIKDIEEAGISPAPPERNYKTKSFISYPITMGGRKVGLLNVASKRTGEPFDDIDVSLLEIVGPQIAVAMERAEWHQRATQFQLMSITDPLTGLLNRRYLEERLTEELSRSQRYNYSMSCLMIDIDDFKAYNDRNGHQAGDVALKITAHSLKAALRSADIACRYGGEEFCILLPQTTVSEAGVIAERMRQKVADTAYPHGASQPSGHVSISVGISTFAKHIDTAESVIAAADRALYTAKSFGKNRIEFYVENLTGTAIGK